MVPVSAVSNNIVFKIQKNRTMKLATSVKDVLSIHRLLSISLKKDICDLQGVKYHVTF